jgi:NH3-dependent NAD+ synthetase
MNYNLSINEIKGVVTTLKTITKFPSKQLISKEIKCGITFEELDVVFNIDEDDMDIRINQLQQEQQEKFDEFYEKLKSFWSVEVEDIKDRIKELSLV